MFRSDLKLVVFYHGFFGERFIANLLNYTNSCPSFGACGIDACTKCKEGVYDFSKNLTAVFEMPDPNSLPEFIDNAEDFLPGDIPKADIAIAINLHPDLLIALPSKLQGRIKALIVPIEESKWCTPGLVKQLSERCEELGIEFSAPKPFCNLRENKEKPLISRFIREFGLGYPIFRIELDGKRIRRVQVLRSQPCGAAWYIAIKLKNYVFEDMRDLWNRISEAHHSFPCVASMEVDREYNETLLHIAGYIARRSINKAIGYTGDEEIPRHVMKVIM